MRWGTALLLGVLPAVCISAPVAEVLESGSGEVRGAFISSGVGARAVGMGEAYTAVADDASAVTWNPGGLGRIRSFSALAALDSVCEGIGVSHAMVAFPAGPVTIGLGLSILSFGPYDVRDADGIKSGTASFNDTAAVVGAAVRHPKWVGMPGWSGISVEFVSETAGGGAFGLGLGSVVPLGNLFTAGWAVEHLGPAKDGFSLPMTAKLGASVAPVTAIRIALDAGYLPSAGQPFAAAGLEFQPVRSVAVRAGYRYRSAQTLPAGLTGVTAGAGVRFGPVGFDYAYQPFGDLAVSHRIALVYGAAQERRKRQ